MSESTGRRPSIKDVASAAGVSVATAGRVLGGYGTPAPHLVEAVNSAAAELGYQGNDLARGMKSGYSRTVGAVITDIENPFFAVAVKGMIAAAEASGYQLLITTTDGQVEREKTALRSLFRKQVDGVILVPSSTSEGAHVAKLGRHGLPIVLVDREIDGLSDVDSVVIDNKRGARRAVGYLIEAGHRNIAIITEAPPETFDDDARHGDRSGMPSLERSRGYLKALQESAIRLDPDLVVSTGPTRHAAYAATQGLLARRPDVTAVFCTDNTMTSGAYQALQDAGIPLPDGISILGFDDHEWSTMVRPTLTVVAQPAFDVGQRAFALLVERMRGTAPESSRSERLESWLVKRDSVTSLRVP